MYGEDVAVYNHNSPARNDFNAWGRTPGVGFASGLARWTFSLVELGVGAVGFSVAALQSLVQIFFGFRSGVFYGRSSEVLFTKGARDFWLGLMETASFGFYQQIDEQWEVSVYCEAISRNVLSLLGRA